MYYIFKRINKLVIVPLEARQCARSSSHSKKSLITPDILFKPRWKDLPSLERASRLNDLRSTTMSFSYILENISSEFIKNNTNSRVQDAKYFHDKVYCNKFFLNKHSDFLLHDNNIRDFWLINTSLTVFLTDRANHNFHKNSKISWMYKKFSLENSMLDSLILANFDIKFDNFLVFLLSCIIFISIYKYSNRIELPKCSKSLNINYEVSYSDYTSQANEYSRESLINYICFSFGQFLAPIVSIFKIEISFTGLNNFVASLIAFLESSDIIICKKQRKSQYNPLSGRGDITESSVYSFSSDISMPVYMQSEFPIYDYEFNRVKPFIFINKGLFIDNHFYYGMPLQVGDNIFASNYPYSSNSSYGYLERSEDSSRIYYDKRSSKNKFEFLSKSRVDLLKFLQMENNTEIYVPLTSFLDVINDFIHYEGLYRTDISLETPYERLINVFGDYRETTSPESKMYINNILRVFHFKKFYEYILMCPLTKKIIDGDHFSTFYHFFFFDFRGRKYYRSMILFTSFKPSRFFMTYGFYKPQEFINVITRTLSTKAYKEVLNSFNDLYYQKCLHDVNVHYSFGVCSSERARFLLKMSREVGVVDDSLFPLYSDFSNAMLFVFFEKIGVVFKNRLFTNSKSSDKDNFVTHTDLVGLGIREYKLFLSEKDYLSTIADFEDRLRLKFLFHFIQHGCNFLHKIPLGYDVSSSGHQISLAWRSDTNLSNFYKVNLDGWNKAYDLYTSILTGFKNSLLERSPFMASDSIKVSNILQLFTRNSIKRAVMTHGYSVSLSSFSKYIKNFSDEFQHVDAKLLSEIIKLFYNYNDDFVNTNSAAFTKSSENFSFYASDGRGIDVVWAYINEGRFKYHVVLGDGFEVNFGEFDKIIASRGKRFEIEAFNKDLQPYRWSTTITMYSLDVNEAKSRRSARPNFTHAIDGLIIRLVVIYHPLSSITDSSLLTVHDEFWSPYQENFIFKDHFNAVMKLDFFSKLNKVFLSGREFYDITGHPLNHSDPKFLHLFSYFIIF